MLTVIPLVLFAVPATRGVVAIDGLAVGLCRAGKWVSVGNQKSLLTSQDSHLPSYQIATDGTVKPVSATLKFISDEGPEGLISWYAEPREAGLAIWFGARPRPTKLKPISAAATVYLAVVHSYLEGKGIKGAEPIISSASRVDLDGDGDEEVIIFASSRRGEDMRNTLSLDGATQYPHDYSVVLVRYQGGKTGREVKTVALCHADGRKGSLDGYWNAAGLSDLDGRKGVEILVQSHYYEGGGGLVFGFSSGKIKKLAENVVGV